MASLNEQHPTMQGFHKSIRRSGLLNAETAEEDYVNVTTSQGSKYNLDSKQ